MNKKASSCIALICGFVLGSFILGEKAVAQDPPAPVQQALQSGTSTTEDNLSGDPLENKFTEAFNGWSELYDGYGRVPNIFDPKGSIYDKDKDGKKDITRQYPELAFDEQVSDISPDKQPNRHSFMRLNLGVDDEIFKTTMAMYQPIRTINADYAGSEQVRDDYLDRFASVLGVAQTTLAFLDKTVAASLNSIQAQVDQNANNQMLKQIAWSSARLANPQKSSLYDDVDEKIEACMIARGDVNLLKTEDPSIIQMARLNPDTGQVSYEYTTRWKEVGNVELQRYNLDGDRCEQICGKRPIMQRDAEHQSDPPITPPNIDEGVKRGLFNWCVCCAEASNTVNSVLGRYDGHNPRSEKGDDPFTSKNRGWSLVERVFFGNRGPTRAGFMKSLNTDEYVLSVVDAFKVFYGDILLFNQQDVPDQGNLYYDGAKPNDACSYQNTPDGVPQLVCDYNQSNYNGDENSGGPNRRKFTLPRLVYSMRYPQLSIPQKVNIFRDGCAAGGSCSMRVGNSLIQGKLTAREEEPCMGPGAERTTFAGDSVNELGGVIDGLVDNGKTYKEITNELQSLNNALGGTLYRELPDAIPSYPDMFPGMPDVVGFMNLPEMVEAGYELTDEVNSHLADAKFQGALDSAIDSAAETVPNRASSVINGVVNIIDAGGSMDDAIELTNSIAHEIGNGNAANLVEDIGDVFDSLDDFKNPGDISSVIGDIGDVIGENGGGFGDVIPINPATNAKPQINMARKHKFASRISAKVLKIQAQKANKKPPVDRSARLVVGDGVKLARLTREVHGDEFIQGGKKPGRVAARVARRGGWVFQGRNQIDSNQLPTTPASSSVARTVPGTANAAVAANPEKLACPLTGLEIKHGICPSLKMLIAAYPYKDLSTTGISEGELQEYWVEASLGKMLTSADISRFRKFAGLGAEALKKPCSVEEEVSDAENQGTTGAAPTDSSCWLPTQEERRWINSFCDAAALSAFKRFHIRFKTLVLDHMSLNQVASQRDKEQLLALVDRVSSNLSLAEADVKADYMAEAALQGIATASDRKQERNFGAAVEAMRSRLRESADNNSTATFGYSPN